LAGSPHSLLVLVHGDPGGCAFQGIRSDRKDVVAQPEDYSANWQAYRRLRNVWWVLLLAWLPSTIVFALISNAVIRTPAPALVVAAVWLLTWMVVGALLQRWRCPRCGKWFSLTWFYGLGYFARKCVHCGLPKYAKHG
jgi:FtsH-binding integral membrane protein